jgi:predicted O-methyltransferase YrrM
VQVSILLCTNISTPLLSNSNLFISQTQYEGGLLMLLKNLNCPIEEYASSYVDEIYADIKAFSEMRYQESCFLNGLVRYFKPKKILEVGVAAGASSCVLLNAIKDDPDAILHSVDWSKEYYREPSKSTGWKAQELFPDCPRWNLHLGVDIAEIIEDRIKGDIDFVLLDTVHAHPAETLSFLSAFPYLSENSVVVLHDVNLFFSNHQPVYATKILFDSVVADKITLNTFENECIHPNIAAFQINGDTKKYIGDVVRSLFFPWVFEEPARILQATEAILETKYCPDVCELYRKSVKQNQIYFSKEQRLLEINSILLILFKTIAKTCLPSFAVVFLKKWWKKWQLRKWRRNK